MALIAGVDSSTQSTKVEIRDQETGAVVASAAAPHPAVIAPCSEQDPASWWSAFELAWAQAGSPNVAAISVAGQQHAMVVLDADGVAVHPAKLWNDTESAGDADRLTGLVSPADWAAAIGSVPVAAFTVTKLAWLARTHADVWPRVRHVMLPHDYITNRLTGQLTAGSTTDRGDASGTGYWSPAEDKYRIDFLDLVDDTREWESMLPRVLGPMDHAGHSTSASIATGAVVAPGTGDNMAGALGVGLRPGDAVISIGTSGTVYAVSNTSTSDPSGAVAGFADATGRFLPLVCTSNAAKVLDAVARLLGTDHIEFDRLALAASPEGPTLLPYFDGERTPNRPNARGVIGGLRSDITREQFARAAVDGVACGLLDGLDALRALTVLDGRVMLTGGGARSHAMQQIVASLIDAPVVLSSADEAVATGAAVQACAILEQVPHSVIQDRWGLGAGAEIDPAIAPDTTTRARYAVLRDRTPSDG
jgi:xylulokinase